jgi:hypothetical protein
MTIEDRYEAIITSVAVDDTEAAALAVRDVELVNLLLYGSHVEQEQAAFRRLFRGYRCKYNRMVSC